MFSDDEIAENYREHLLPIGTWGKGLSAYVDDGIHGRENSAEFLNLLKAKRKRDGQCVDCGMPVHAGKRRCLSHLAENRIKARYRMVAIRKSRRAASRCLFCDDLRDRGSKSMCARH